MAPPTRFSPVRLRAAARRKEAFGLRCQGLTFKQIAAHMGISKTRAVQIIGDAMTDLQQVREEAARAYFAEALARLEELYQLAVIQAREGTLPALEATLKVIDRQAKLLGLDAPMKTEAKLSGSLSGLSDEQLLAEAERLGLPDVAGYRQQLLLEHKPEVNP